MAFICGDVLNDERCRYLFTDIFAQVLFSPSVRHDYIYTYLYHSATEFSISNNSLQPW